jgi:hypothetical protein
MRVCADQSLIWIGTWQRGIFGTCGTVSLKFQAARGTGLDYARLSLLAVVKREAPDTTYLTALSAIELASAIMRDTAAQNDCGGHCHVLFGHICTAHFKSSAKLIAQATNSLLTDTSASASAILLQSHQQPYD